MAIIAYASANAADPLISQADGVYDLSLLPLGGSMPLYGAGKEDGSGTLPAGFTYLWTIIDKPAGSLARFVDSTLQTSTLQNPTIENLDVWGNYLIFLQVTNPATGHSSTATPMTLDAVKARVNIRLLSKHAGIQKLAKLDWNWKTQINEWAATIESLASTTLALPAAVLQLIGGGYAFLGVLLHKHRGPDVDPAAVGTRGAVGLSDTPVDAGNPVVSNKLYDFARGHSAFSLTALGTTALIVPQTVIPGSAQKLPHFLFALDETYVLDTYDVTLLDGGDTGNYAFSVYMGSETDWRLGTPTHIVAGDFSVGVPGGNLPFHRLTSLGGQVITGKRFIGIVCETCPTNPGTLLSVTLQASKTL